MVKPIQVDVIILSYAKTDALKELTQQTIGTLLASENPSYIQFNVLVIESNKDLKPYQFENSKTIYPDTEFGFHKYLNIGIQNTNNPYLCLCNNDLIFQKCWATEILKIMDTYPQIKSANPYCKYFHPKLGFNTTKEMVIGTKNNLLKGVLTGWCIFVKREIFDVIGMLDEQFLFWYADRDYGRTLLKHNIKHALVTGAHVDHLGNQSHDTLEGNFEIYTASQKQIYERKWGKESSTLFARLKAAVKKIINA